MADVLEGMATNVYYDRHFDINAVKLLPGEFYVTGEKMMLVTVLGSCVAACIRDPQFGIGGMNHFMLPESVHEADSPLSSSARYGTYAMEVLINQLIKLGARRNKLEAKVFGGGNVLRGFTVNNVGDRNAAFVLDFLKTEKIPVLAQDLIDIYPRKVYFIPQTGKVMVKKLRSMHNTTIVKRENDYSQRLRSTRVEGDVELFG
ncbi:MAG: chemoreceptor glutamine deamidase CheD [Burkholderiales bacterium]